MRAGEWERAAQVARAQQMDVDVQDALELLTGFQEQVRARRYSKARSTLDGYRAALGRAPADAPERDVVRLAAPPEQLEAALDGLDGLQKETDPAALASGLEPALSHPLTRAEALNMQGILSALMGDAIQGRLRLEEALQADPKHYRALTNLGNLDLEAGDVVSAERRYREVIALNPDYDGGHHNLGVALRRQGKVSESVAAIRRGQRLSVKRSQEDTRADIKEQYARSPVLRNMRWIILVVLVLAVVLLMRSAGA
ncbi:tetratricopeptide repeat protein [Deinococcus deserti]